VLDDAGFATRCNRMLTKTVATDSTHSLIVWFSAGGADCMPLSANVDEKTGEIGLQCSSCAAML